MRKAKKKNRSKASTQRKTTKAKPLAAKKTKAARKASAKKKASRKKSVSRKTTGARSQVFDRRTREGYEQQSGDLQGLSRTESVDSESVDELLEEGNSFEAGVVSGVEEADDQEGREVHTHEVPEDDVPEEYLDKE